MPFQKGRQKTGGRKKGGAVRKSNRLVDQLKDHGFNFVREFANALRDLPINNTSPGTRYSELKSLLPYMAPKLREKEVELIDKDTAGSSTVNSAPISDDDLIKALDNGTDKQSNVRSSPPAPVAKRNIELQAAPSPEVNLQDMVTQQEDN